VFFNTKSLSCRKITEGKFDKERIFKGGQIFVISKVKEPPLLGPITKYINLNDTVIITEWDIENGLSIIEGHTAGKLILNEKTNLITIEKRYWHDSKKKTVRKFKILKFTSTEVILIDFSNMDKNRKYYFK
jgi:hypothetical protein